ncbi:MAG TPA: hypothetical protein DCY14_14780 [Anaerolineae bacterium]|mgnify:CR=1 FL=1|nr:hypothetical protein [Anaerolineae bacterium]HRJ56465.1 hypothetical protein [Anaerolineales bacterium]
MPEVSKDAAILIATSYQALKRVEKGEKSTEIANCVVVILFAGFFIEENLNVIIKKMKMNEEMRVFLNGKEHPGLLDKIAWFYNQYVSSERFSSKKELFKKDLNGNPLILNKLEKRFPGIKEIIEYRNKIAHGEIKTVNITKAKKLREQAKIITDELFDLAKQNGFDIPRNITYKSAIT